MIMLLIGFGAIALIAVLLPLIERRRNVVVKPDTNLPVLLEEREAAALAELRDLEFDHRLGKLSEEDYRELRAHLARQAVAGLKAVDTARAAEAAREKELDDLIERKVAERRQMRRQAAVNGRRTCPACGKQAAPGDRFCVACGTVLLRACPHCEAILPDEARFCPKCGHILPESATASIPTFDQSIRRRPARARQPETPLSTAVTRGPFLSKWLLAAGIAATIWAVVVGVFYFRARAAFASQRPIATLTAEDYHSLAILPGDPNFTFFGHHGGLMWSSEGGVSWQPASVAGDAMALVVHAANPLRIYLGGHGLFLRSDDGGRNWQEVVADLPGNDIHALAAAPDDPDTLYAYIVGYGLWRSANGGMDWSPVDTTLSENVTALAIAPGTIYVGTDGLGVLQTDDGLNWASANGYVNGALDSARVRALAYDPATGTLYAGTDRGLSFTINVGSGWTRRPFNGDVAALTLSPDGTTMLLMTSNGRLFRSRDRGVTWGN